MSRLLHEQSAQRKVTCARLPVQPAPPSSPTSMGVPPPVQCSAPASKSNGAAGTHFPPAHPVPAPHPLPQPPQFALSLLGSTQAPAQGMRPERQLVAHAFAEQTVPAVHWIPHPPQLFGSPLAGMHPPSHEIW